MTKERKRVFHSFILFEYKSMEEYFEKMALQGWMLDKIGFGVLQFRKIRPKKIRFSLDIFPYLGVFDSIDSQRALEYRDLCQSSGWTYLGSLRKVQVFYTDQEDIPPLQTSREEERKIIKKTLYSPEIFLLLSLLLGCLFLSTYLLKNSYEFLTSNSKSFFIVMVLVLMVYCLWKIFYYFIWYRKIKQSIELGKPWPKTSVRKYLFRNYLDLIVIEGLLLIYFILLVQESLEGRPYNLLRQIPIFLPAIAGVLFSSKILKGNRSRGENIGIFILLLAVLISLNTYFVAKVLDSDKIKGVQVQGPEDVELVHLQDYGVDEKIDSKSYLQEFSLLVPRSYQYVEFTPQNHLRIDYYQAKNRKWARLIFEQIAQFEGSRGNFRIIQTSPASEWGVDKAYYLNKDKSLIVVLKDRRVYLLENSLGFTHNYVINVSKKLWDN